jgi:hypothetical protein
MNRILNSELPLYCYVSPLYITETEGSNKVLVERQGEINKGIKHFMENKSNLETCQNLKNFLDFKLAELKLMNYPGAYYDQMVEKIEDLIETLKTGIELGEKEQMYHSAGGSQVYKGYDWYNEEHKWDTQTMEGYLKSHYREFSVPTYTFKDFMYSGYFKHCLIHNWDARETAETFCRLYHK